MNNHRIEMVHPEYRRIFDDTSNTVEETLTPVYPKTEGVHQAMLRNLVDQVLLKLDSHNLDEYVPAAIQQLYGFPDLGESIKTLHHPPPETAVELLEECKHPAQQRMIFEELLAHQLSLLAVRQRVKHEQAVELNPNLSRTLVVLGFAQLIRFDTAAAKIAFNRAIELDSQ